MIIINIWICIEIWAYIPDFVIWNELKISREQWFMQLSPGSHSKNTTLCDSIILL